MATGDLPKMFTSSRDTSSYTTANLMGGVGAAVPTASIFAQRVSGAATAWPDHYGEQDVEAKVFTKTITEPEKAKMAAKNQRRMVQVFIMDPDPAVPLNDAMVYRGDQHLTEATDQELFFELPMKQLLDEHNARRSKVINKKVLDRTEYLEPTRIGNLSMVVVNVAVFAAV